MINNIDWQKEWQKEIGQHKRKKDWNTVANKFKGWLENDDYGEKLLHYMKIEPTDTVLDLGAGEGSITIPVSKKSRKVLAVDKSEKMLKLLKENSKKEGLENIETLNEDIFNINKEKVGEYDIVLASRSVSGTYQMRELLETLNDIANKYVYITLYGPENKREANKALEHIGKDKETVAHYGLVFNLLISMGINPNVANLECESVKTYDSLEEAIERFKWKIGDITKEQKEKLNKYLENVFVENKDGRWENPNDTGEWTLIWWKTVK